MKYLKLIVISFIIVAFTGCTSMAQHGAMIQAYDSYKNHDYVRVLNKASQAESYQTPTPDLHAEILFLKVLALEKLGKVQEAKGILEYTVAHYPSTQYGSMATIKLKEMEKNPKIMNNNSYVSIQQNIDVGSATGSSSMLLFLHQQTK